jgi:thioredoxin-related protein
MKRILLAALIVASASCFGVRGSEGWVEDFQVALDQAEKEKKDLLLDFTGSDWCGWCIKLKKEVFDQEAFKKAAPEHFILVEIDFPRSKPVKAANKELQGIFEVQGYPTIILTDSQGRAYAKTGYQEGGPEKYLAHLDELRKVKKERDELFAKAAGTEGVEKAKLLDQALSQLEAQQVLIGYQDEVKQLLAADKDNAAGLRNKYLAKQQMDEVLKEVNTTRDVKAALAKIDKIVKELNPPGPMKQQLFIVKASLLKAAQDEEGMMQALVAAQQADPLSEMGERLKEHIEQLKKQPKDQPQEAQ